MNTLQSYLSFIRYLLQRFIGHRCIRTASALTYATVFALIPALVLIVSVFRKTVFFKNYSHPFWSVLFANVVPDAAGGITRDYLEQFVRHARGVTIIGAVIFALSVITLFLMLDRSLNAVWHVQRPRSMLWRVLYASLWLIAGPVFIGVALSVGGLLVGSTINNAGSPSILYNGIFDWVSCLFNSVALVVLYRITPRAYVPWRHALVSGVLVALALEALKAGLAHYVRYIVTEKVVYGAFAGVPIFLLWVHACWIAIFAGAVSAAAWPHRFAPPAQAWPSMAQRITLSATVLTLLDGVPSLSIEELQRRTKTGYDELAWVFDQLVQLNLITCVSKQLIERTGEARPPDEALIGHYLTLASEVH